MVDIHSHILFGIDDGSETIERSVEMLRRASLCGTEKIILTPHCNMPLGYTNYWDESLKNRFEQLQQAVTDTGIDIEILPGQEIFCIDNTIDLLKSGDLITLNFSRYCLVEFDFNELSSSVYTRLERLVANGYVPVVAHPERYSFVQENSNAPSIMKGIGCLFQVNKDSLLGNFGREAKLVADYFIKNEFADFVGSDCHNIHLRNPNLSDVYEWISEHYSEDYAEYLLVDNPYSLINDDDISL